MDITYVAKDGKKYSTEQEAIDHNHNAKIALEKFCEKHMDFITTLPSDICDTLWENLVELREILFETK